MEEADGLNVIPRPCRIYFPVPENYMAFNDARRLTLGTVGGLWFALALVA